MERKTILLLTALVVLTMTFSGFLTMWGSGEVSNSFTTGSAGTTSTQVLGSSSSTAVAVADDSAGNIFVLWSNGQVYEHANLGGSGWIYLGNSSAFGSFNNQSLTLGNPVGVRASVNWQSSGGAMTGLVMVLYSNGYAAMLEYGVNPHVWQLSKLPSGNHYVALSNNLNSYTYRGAGNQVFYATENDGITYAYSDAFYSWVETINTTISHNITATTMWLCNGGSSIGDLRYAAITHSGYFYFNAPATYTSATNWTLQGNISAKNPDFVSLTMTPNPFSANYYYAIEGGANSTIYASGCLVGITSSKNFVPVCPTGTKAPQVAVQNNYFGLTVRANELILENNGNIVQSSSEGDSFSSYYSAPSTPTPQKQINVLAWVCQFCTARDKQALSQINATYNDYTMISYEFYALQSDHTIISLPGYSSSSSPNNLTPYVQKLGLGAVPMITSASGGDIYNFTSNQSAVSAAIAQMTDLAIQYNYSGYDIDWEPTASSVNSTTAAYYDSFLNQFSLQLDKFGKSLIVEVASWDPTFWNYTNIGNTNVTSVDVMDYAASYAGPESFLADLQQAVQQIPLGKLSIALENTNPNTNANFSAAEMQQRFASLEQYGVKFAALWVLPVVNSLTSQLQDYIQNYTGTTYMNTFSPGSSGISVSNIANLSAGNVTFSYNSGSYLYGTGYTSTYLAPGTSITSIKYSFTGSQTVGLFEQNSTGWHFVVNLTAGTNTFALTSPAQNIKFAFGDFTGVNATANYTSYVNYTLSYTKLTGYSWIDVYYQSAGTLKVNNATVTASDVTSYGPWSFAQLPVVPGTYNVTVERFGYIGYYDNLVTTVGTASVVSSEIEALPGTIHGYVSPGTATVTVNNAPVSVSNGQFTFSGAPGSYTIVASAPFYNIISDTVAVSPDFTTIVYVNMTFSTLTPVVQYSPLNVNNTSYSLAWSALYGTDFVNYSIYVSTSSGSLGHFVASITSVSDTSYNLTGLSYGTTYYVTIVTYAEGQHASSNVESFTTPVHTSPSSSLSSADLIYIVVGVVVAVVVIAAVVMLMRPKKPKS